MRVTSQQVVDQTRLKFDVATDDLQRQARRGQRVGDGFEFGDHRQHGREGVAQLVAELGEELVFGSVGVG